MSPRKNQKNVIGSRNINAPTRSCSAGSKVEEKTYLNAVNIVFGVEKVRKLIISIGSAKKIWKAGKPTLLKAGLQGDKIDKILERREETDPEEEWEKLEEKSIQLVFFDDEDYPPLLRQIHSAPVSLYVRGDKKILSEPSVAVVGTRSPSSYGQGVAESLAGDVASSGLVVVSGLAQGIDAISHKAAIDRGGKTVAVLGSGIDTLFPKINKSLGESIIKDGGAVASEYPAGTPPLKQHFPARNRIVSGLSFGVLVIESRDPGGSLITAGHALDQNREVFAVPGDIRRSTSVGTNKIISQGAKLVRSAQDVFDELSAPMQKEIVKEKIKGLTNEEKNILEILDLEPLHVDMITKKTKLKPSRTNSVLSSLEIKGVIRDTGGNIYERLS